MKKLLLLCLSLITIGIILYSFPSKSDEITNKIERKTFKIAHDDDGKSPEARARFTEQRLLYEYYRQVNPLTGEIPKEEKLLEFDRSKKAKLKTNSSSRTIETTFINRGPTNFGGRTRALVIDRSDNTGNTIIAGGVSSGVFRTTDGGASWTKVSSNDEIHNVTAIVQDPRSGFESTWYYGTGESIGNSASLSGSSYLGQGIWKSTNGGVTWTQMPSTASSQTSYDSYFDFIFKLAVHPITGDLYAAVAGALLRYDGSWHIEKENGSITPSKHTDVVIASDGRVYASFSGKCDSSIEGVWTKNPSTGIWSRINTTPGPDFTPENNPSDNKENGVGRVVLALAPSNENKLYILFDTGLVSDCDAPLIEAELWMWDQSITTFTDYSSKLPDETGCSEGNDPFAIQGGYDLVVSVKPDNENFVVIGGTNAYKIGNITTDSSFLRIGGYRTSTSYFPYGYDTDPGDEHHPDIHAMVFDFDPNRTSVLYTGTDGGVHKTTNVIAGVVSWTSLNNNYQTLQYYHVAIDPLAGEDRFIGGTQDNGTTAGGTDFGMPDTVTQTKIWLGDGVSVGISRDDACVPFFYGYQSGYIRRDCPTPGVEITPDGSESEFVTLFHLDQSNNNALYYAGKG
ncbi:MAG TPA: hypothetical protein VGA80_05390, partial [Flavobacteriaceae bacterium]